MDNNICNERSLEIAPRNERTISPQITRITKIARRIASVERPIGGSYYNFCGRRYVCKMAFELFFFFFKFFISFAVFPLKSKRQQLHTLDVFKFLGFFRFSIFSTPFLSQPPNPHTHTHTLKLTNRRADLVCKTSKRFQGAHLPDVNQTSVSR